MKTSWKRLMRYVIFVGYLSITIVETALNPFDCNVGTQEGCDIALRRRCVARDMIGLKNQCVCLRGFVEWNDNCIRPRRYEMSFGLQYFPTEDKVQQAIWTVLKNDTTLKFYLFNVVFVKFRELLGEKRIDIEITFVNGSANLSNSLVIISPESLLTSLKTDIDRHYDETDRKIAKILSIGNMTKEEFLATFRILDNTNPCVDMALNFCDNSAQCTRTGIETFRCQCPGPLYIDDSIDRGTYPGESCKDTCEGYCYNDGFCNYVDNKRTCSCTKSFWGDRCEIPIAAVLGVCITVLLLIIIIACVFAYKKWKERQKEKQQVNKWVNQTAPEMNPHDPKLDDAISSVTTYQYQPGNTLEHTIPPTLSTRLTHSNLDVPSYAIPRAHLGTPSLEYNSTLSEMY